MNNEPVAWMQTFTQEYKGVIETKHAVNIERIGINDIPLYTHPTKHDLGIAEAIGFDKGYQAAMEKTLTSLTEDECEAIINKHDWYSKSWREMAKEIHDAILRKAQEK